MAPFGELRRDPFFFRKSVEQVRIRTLSAILRIEGRKSIMSNHSLHTRTIRGGAATTGSEWLDVPGYRAWSPPESHVSSVGFRVVKRRKR